MLCSVPILMPDALVRGPLGDPHRIKSPKLTACHPSSKMKFSTHSFAVVTGILASAIIPSAQGQVTVGLPASAAEESPLTRGSDLTVSVGLPASAADASQISYAGNVVDNIFVPKNPGLALSLGGVTVPPVNLGTFDIVIAPNVTLAGNAAALAAFNRAAMLWEARISDPITITIDANLAALGAGIIGSTSSVTLVGSYTTIRNSMVTDSSDEVDDAIVGSLPTAGQFAATIPAVPASTLSGQVLVTKANAKALGFSGLDVAFGISDATITFSTSFSFDFDNSDGIGFGLIDFETVAAHEIGHALGFFSIVDSVNDGETNISPNTLDLFRFADGSANDPATAGNFSTFARDLVPGTNAINDEINGATPELRMATGLTNVSFPGTDGNQASHWKADEQTSIFIGLMDPTLSFGQFYPPQNTDFRAMDLVGYEIVNAPVPEPSVLSALLLGSAFLAGRPRRARR